MSYESPLFGRQENQRFVGHYILVKMVGMEAIETLKTLTDMLLDIRFCGPNDNFLQRPPLKS
jgi:hypothetical protein